MQLLIIEDEVKAAEHLRKEFSRNGFFADVANTGKSGLCKAMTGKYQLIILDMDLPELSGWSVLSELHGSSKDIPVLFLTSRDAVEDRIKGLELGADDYLVKPFVFSELLARVETIMRRGISRQPDVLTVEGLVVDLVLRKAMRSNRPLNLTSREFALLSFLAGRAGEVVSRTQIVEQVWDMNLDSDTNMVDVAIRRLRAKVDDPFENKLIHTFRGVGYVLEAR
jgi:two-component system copper resistance phosphate regulon response regulator CusR